LNKYFFRFTQQLRIEACPLVSPDYCILPGCCRFFKSMVICCPWPVFTADRKPGIQGWPA